MTSRKRTESKSFEVTIEKLVHGGAGFARYQGKVAFVPFSAPGDRLIVRIEEEKKTFVRTSIARILEPGKTRTTPPCAHFEKCGGCHWQHLQYSIQVEAKRQMLEEIFHHRFPQTREISIEMQACPRPFGYRSRARVQLRGAGQNALVGFFRCGSHAVIDIESCPLFRPSLNEALASVRQFKLKVDTDSGPQEMEMACAEEEDSWATEKTGTDANAGAIPLLGARGREQSRLNRQVGEFIYAVTPSVFFQANDFMAPELVSLVRECARTAGGETALDLFCGVGLFSLPLARQFDKVIAVENSADAARLCARNAGTAGLGNLQAVCADAGAWMHSSDASARTPVDLIVLDPPRTGAGQSVMHHIRERSPKTIIYVSCDPQTLVRDLATLSPSAYRISFVRGLDMFPQTFHFETVVRLEKT
jgi:23S rRNA (uracil1939-C5)-methyltransferase